MQGLRRAHGCACLARVAIGVVAVSAVFASAAGCRGVPITEVTDPDAMAVKIDVTSTRIFKPDRGFRFDLTISNRTSRGISFDSLEVTLRATPPGQPEITRLVARGDYASEEVISIEAGRYFRFSPPLKVYQFNLAGLSPGDYEIRAEVCDRVISKPYPVRVERPDLRRALRR